MIRRAQAALFAITLVTVLYGLHRTRRVAHAEDPLPSWNDGRPKRAILEFVRAVTDRSAPTFVPEADRIATFDNDGTLWVEQPMYTQLQFAIDRVHALAHAHPEWKSKPPFSAILSADKAALGKLSEHDAAAIVAATHSDMTPEQFQRIVSDWFATAEHPRFRRLYRDCTYQPMLELLAYLRASGFRTFIVSGGGVDFMRAVAGDVYGMLPAQVIGSSGKTEYQLHGDKADLTKLPEVSSIDDGTGKPININLHIGQRPIFAAGNADGDLPMLQYATRGGAPYPRLALLVHHDDAQREYAYDRQSAVGRLDRALRDAPEEGFVVVSMDRDWNQLFRRTKRGKKQTAQTAAKSVTR